MEKVIYVLKIYIIYIDIWFIFFNLDIIKIIPTNDPVNIIKPIIVIITINVIPEVKIVNIDNITTIIVKIITKTTINIIFIVEKRLSFDKDELVIFYKYLYYIKK